MMNTVREQVDADGAIVALWQSQAGVAVRAAPAAGDVGLVLVDRQDAPIACLRLCPRVGMGLPRYSYHLGRVVHAAAELKLFLAQQTLLLGNDHTGESELSELACAPGLSEAQRVEALIQLTLAALERIRAQPQAFGQRLIVELAGPRDGQGHSPFWQGLGGVFYSGDPDAAQARFGDAWRSHLAALLPRQTLYLSFLSEGAQAALGQVGAPGQSAAQTLRVCGFAFAQHVRIDDGGPLMEIGL